LPKLYIGDDFFLGISFLVRVGNGPKHDKVLVKALETPETRFTILATVEGSKAKIAINARFIC